MASKVDPSKERSIMVLTKPDQCIRSDERTALSLISEHYRGPTDRRQAGTGAGAISRCIVVRNPTQEELDRGITPKAARDEEKSFFADSATFQGVPRDQRGCDSLVASLTALLIDRIRSNFPDMKKGLRARHEEVSNSLAALGDSVRTEDAARRAVNTTLLRVTDGIRECADSEPVPKEQLLQHLDEEAVDQLARINVSLQHPSPYLRSAQVMCSVASTEDEQPVRQPNPISTSMTMYSFITLHETALEEAVNCQVPTFVPAQLGSSQAGTAATPDTPQSSTSPPPDSLEEMILLLKTNGATHHVSRMSQPTHFYRIIKHEVNNIQGLALQHLKPVHHAMLSFCKMVVGCHAQQFPKLYGALIELVTAINNTFYQLCEHHIKQYLDMRSHSSSLFVPLSSLVEDSSKPWIKELLSRLHGTSDEAANQKGLQQMVLVYWSTLRRSSVSEVIRASRWFLVNEVCQAIRQILTGTFLESLRESLGFSRMLMELTDDELESFHVVRGILGRNRGRTMGMLPLLDIIEQDADSGGHSRPLVTIAPQSCSERAAGYTPPSSYVVVNWRQLVRVVWPDSSGRDLESVAQADSVGTIAMSMVSEESDIASERRFLVEKQRGYANGIETLKELQKKIPLC